MIFSVSIYVIIYVIKTSDNEAVDIAIAVANALRITYISVEIAETSKMWQNYCCYSSFSGSN